MPQPGHAAAGSAGAANASLADAAARVPGESLLAAIRRDYAERIAAGDVTLGPPTATFTRMVHNSHVLTSRGREIEDMREQALGDAIAAETGADDPQQRIVAAQLASVHRVLFAETPGASWPASRATRSARCSRRLAGPKAASGMRLGLRRRLT